MLLASSPHSATCVGYTADKSLAVRQQLYRQHPRRPYALISASTSSQTTVASVSDRQTGPTAVTSSTGPSTSQPSSSEQQQPGWQECMQHVQQLGFDEADAERFVQRAFGWGPKGRAYWRHEKAEQTPNVQQIQAALRFLTQQLGMADEQIVKLIKAFPEVLGCDVEQQLQGNVNKLGEEWRLQGDVLQRAVLRNPAVLGYTVDCEGNCAGECNRCWARF